MKWIGALLLIATTTWIGFERSGRLSRRPKNIRSLKSALQVLEAEIIYSQATLQEAFLSVSRRVPVPIKIFFLKLSEDLRGQGDFYAIWESRVDQLIKSADFKPNEREILQQFGRTLGQHDLRQQQKHIQLAMLHLDREMEEAVEEHRKYGKMARSLGFLSGMFIVILLI